MAAVDRTPRLATGAVPHRVYNLGNNRPERLLDFIAVIERELGRTATKIFEPLPPGDVPETYADIETSTRDLGFEPRVPMAEGLARFVAWFKQYHAVN